MSDPWQHQIFFLKWMWKLLFPKCKPLCKKSDIKFHFNECGRIYELMLKNFKTNRSSKLIIRTRIMVKRMRLTSMASSLSLTQAQKRLCLTQLNFQRRMSTFSRRHDSNLCKLTIQYVLCLSLCCYIYLVVGSVWRPQHIRSHRQNICRITGWC